MASGLLRSEWLFTGGVILAAALGLASPGSFLWIKPYIPVLLGVVMFGIGLSIETSHLLALVRAPWLLLLLALVKYITMPLLGFGLAHLLGLPIELVIGMAILGACPGGTSVNVMAYFARANTALTVMLTIVTTALSPIATPLAIYLLLHEHVEVNAPAIMEKLFWIVLFPLVDAIIIRRFFMRAARKVEPLLPPLSMLAVCLIIAAVAAINRAALLDNPWLVVLAVLGFNLGGYAIGYGVATLLKRPEPDRQAVAFEFGMQDSSVGMFIALHFFAALSALPCAVCSILQNITGPVLARRFRLKSTMLGA